MSIIDIFNMALPTLLTAVVIPLLVTAGKAITGYFKTRTTNETLQRYFDLANDAVATAVAEVMQTFVSTLKSSGEWNTGTAQQACVMAKLKAQQIMGVAVLQALPAIVGDMETWLTSKVESATLEAKTIQAARAQGTPSL